MHTNSLEVRTNEVILSNLNVPSGCLGGSVRYPLLSISCRRSSNGSKRDRPFSLVPSIHTPSFASTSDLDASSWSVVLVGVFVSLSVPFLHGTRNLQSVQVSFRKTLHGTIRVIWSTW